MRNDKPPSLGTFSMTGADGRNLVHGALAAIPPALVRLQTMMVQPGSLSSCFVPWVPPPQKKKKLSPKENRLGRECAGLG